MWGWITGESSTPSNEGKDTGVKGAMIPGLPSPKNDMEFQMAAAELLEEVRKYAEQENTVAAGWSPVGHSTPNVELFERKIPKLEGSALTFMKAIGNVEGASPADILAFTLEMDIAKRKEFDPDISLLELLRSVTPTLQLTHTQIAAPYPFYHREFVDMRTWVEGDDRILYGSQSINLVDGPVSSEHVRGSSWNGIVLEQVPTGTRIVFMGYVDPSGWVPHAVISMFRGKITERIDIFRKMVEKSKAQKK